MLVSKIKPCMPVNSDGNGERLSNTAMICPFVIDNHGKLWLKAKVETQSYQLVGSVMDCQGDDG